MQARGTRSAHHKASKAAARVATASKGLPSAAPGFVQPDGQAFWTLILGMVSPYGFVRASDAILVGQLCDVLAEYKQCCDEIAAAGGLTYEAESYVNARRDDVEDAPETPGSRLIRAHPAVLIRRRARQDIVAICEKLGMTPSTRYQLLTQAASGKEAGAGAPNAAPSPVEAPSAPAQSPLRFN